MKTLGLPEKLEIAAETAGAPLFEYQESDALSLADVNPIITEDDLGERKK